MARPNFFCDIDSLNCILGMEFGDGYKDIDLTMDLIELPFYFIFTADDENWTVKAMQRGEIYSHDDSGIEKGSVIVNRESGEGQVRATQELGENMGAFFAACRNLSYYMQDNKLEELCADFDPEQEGVLLYVEDDELKYKVVAGKERPEMMCTTLFGGPVMGRPYMDDFMERSAREMMSHEEKIEAAEDGDEDCMQVLALLYLNGDEDEDIDPDPIKALYWLEKSAEEGNSSSAFNAGLFYAKGYGTERNLEKAAEWMERAAEEGDEDAGALAPKYRQALTDITLAENGDAAAQGRLAGFYMSMAGSLEQAGTGDYYEESLKWAKKAAEQGNGDGLWTLALAYEHGRGVAKNVEIAIGYYEQGAEVGHARSLNSLGCYYIRGDVVEQNMKLGFELVLRASLLGDGEAMANLGRCYQFGNGCMGNMKKAIVWYKKSLELIPNEELERKTMIFEMMPDMGEEEDYYGEDSDRELTAEEIAFLDKIDTTLPWEAKDIAQNPDSVFEGIVSENSEVDFADDDEETEDFEGMPAGFMEAMEAFSEAEEYENELADLGVIPDALRPGNGAMSLSAEGFPRVALKAEEGDERALEIIAKMNAANKIE